MKRISYLAVIGLFALAASACYRVTVVTGAPATTTKLITRGRSRGLRSCAPIRSGHGQPVPTGSRR
jgi:hypothetical protein